MSNISERIMRGQYVSKSQCFEHAEEIERLNDCYAGAMAAMEAHERMMAKCTCEWDGDVDYEGHFRSYRTPNATCPVHHQEED